MEQTLRKIHIDSRMKTWGTHSDFEFVLPMTLETVENTIAYIDEASIPHSFSTLNLTNNTLYLAERVGASSPYTYSVRKIEIEPNSYNVTTLSQALLNALNANRPAAVSSVGLYGVLGIILTNKLIISSPDHAFASPTVKFHLLTDDEIAKYDQALLTIDKSVNNANGVVRNRETLGIVSSSAAGFEYDTLFGSGYLDLVAHHNLFIHSSLSMGISSLGPLGQTSILGKVPNTASYGNSIFYQANGAHDYVDIGKQSISTIRLSLKDAFNNTCNLEGASWSCSILFLVKE